MSRRAAAPATSARERNRIVDRALKNASELMAAKPPLNNTRVVADAERWLRSLVQSADFLKLPHDEPALPKPAKPTKRATRTSPPRKTRE